MVGIGTDGERVEVRRPSVAKRATDRRVRTYTELQQTRDRAILDLHDRGWSVPEIAIALGRQPFFVRGRLNPLLAMRAGRDG